jgi:hypothetical protein
MIRNALPKLGTALVPWRKVATDIIELIRLSVSMRLAHDTLSRLELQSRLAACLVQGDLKIQTVSVLQADTSVSEACVALVTSLWLLVASTFERFGRTAYAHAAHTPGKRYTLAFQRLL